MKSFAFSPNYFFFFSLPYFSIRQRLEKNNKFTLLLYWKHWKQRSRTKKTKKKNNICTKGVALELYMYFIHNNENNDRN